MNPWFLAYFGILSLGINYLVYYYQKGQ